MGLMKMKSFLKLLVLIISFTPVMAIAGIVETKYVTLLNSNFNNGTAEGWTLGQGWSVTQSGNNGSLYGTVHSNAQPVVADLWSDFEVTLRFKIEAGGFHFNVRHNPGSVFRRYFLGVSKNGWCYFNKQIGDTFFNNLLSWNTSELNDWHALKVTTAGNQIKISGLSG